MKEKIPSLGSGLAFRSKLRLLIVAVLLLFLFGWGWAAEATAQVTTARLEGIVKDPSDAVVPGAKVVAKQADTNLAYDAVSNETGLYVFAKLPPGSYTVTAEQSGFKRALTEEVRLEIGDTRTLNIKLEAGAVTETITVTSQATTVDTVSTSVGAVVNETQIANLPLVGRNPMNLFFLQAGANRRTDDGYFGGRVDGLRYESNNVVVEGVSATDPFFHSGASVSLAAVPLESVSEYRVVTSSASAEFGRGGGRRFSFSTSRGRTSFTGRPSTTCAIARSTPTPSSATSRGWPNRPSSATSLAARWAGRSSKTRRSSTSPTRESGRRPTR